MPKPKVVIAFDKFRGSATATELSEAAVGAADRLGWDSCAIPLADGGEGSLDVIGGPNKTTVVTSPLGDPVEAGWRLDGRTAYIEMAAASGLTVVGGADQNDAVAADTTGTGELISTAIELGATTVVVFLGGSATTDGGWGAIRAMPPAPRMKGIELIVACDVQTRFDEAATVFGPQKGASPAQVKFLTRRLQRLIQVYQENYGIDVSEVPGAGAAGGLAGGLLALGARLESGFSVLAERAELDVALVGADLVITGEGYLDHESFNGKVVGGVGAWSAAEGVPVVSIVGDRDPSVEAPEHLRVVSLVEAFGLDRAMHDTVELVASIVADELSRRHPT
ncbi:MAG: glycerate kinase [Acidimicrobiales bacterium]